MTTKNLSVFFIKDLDTPPYTDPNPDSVISQITHARPSNQSFPAPSFAASYFLLQSTIAIPVGGDTSVPFCVVNRKGANGDGLLDIFMRKTNDTIGWISSNTGGNGWGSWSEIGGPALPNSATIASGPAVSAIAPDFLGLVVRGSDDNLYRRFFVSSSWGNWITLDPLGAPPNGAVGEPAIIGFPPNNYRIYTRNADGELWYIDFDGSDLGDWTQEIDNNENEIETNDSPEGVDMCYVSNEPGTPTSLSDQEEGLNVFYVGTSNEMRVNRTSGTGFISNANLSGGLTSPSGSAYYSDLYTAPHPSSGNYYRELHTFVRGNDALMYGRYADLNVGSGALTPSSNWYAFGTRGRIFGKPDAVTWDGEPFNIE
jgi:hypothetical protein